MVGRGETTAAHVVTKGQLAYLTWLSGVEDLPNQRVLPVT
jgi:hypothetical protein